MTPHRPPSTAAGGDALILLLLLLTVGAAVAQPGNNNNSSSSNNNNNPYGFNPNFNPSMAIVIVVLVSAFFFLGFFSIYIRQCGGDAGSGSLNPLAVGRAARSRRQRGLDPEVLATFPTLVYSEVKVLKIGKGDLECAVCLSEFDEEETLRLLPGCSHVFHPDCIDAWLASHVTCPVCRSNLADVHVEAAGGEATTAMDPVAAAEPAPPAPPEHVAVEVEPSAEERKADLAELARIASRRSGGTRLPRSHSTGHSLVHQAESQDRFTLRLPEHIRKEIVAAGKMQRAKSLRGFPLHREGSSRRGYRVGGAAAAEGSSRGGRSIRLGRTERWPSILLRNFSARMPAWGRRWDREGSVKNPAGGEDPSTKGRPSSFRGGASAAGDEPAGSSVDRV